jgi:uncharacterized peroxidase-related enzyme
LVHHGAALARESGDTALAETVASGRLEQLDERMAALCCYAVKLTLTPHEMQRGDIDELRRVGLDDRAIVDANQVVSYYNYVNRIADGLGVELEDSWPEEARHPEILGTGE